MTARWVRHAMARIRRARREGASFARASELLTASTSIPSFEEAADRLQSELDRARRYEHALSVLVLTATPHSNGKGTAQEADEETSMLVQTGMPHIASLLGGATLLEVLRDSDIICYDADDDRLLVALVESGGDEARKAIRRIGELMDGRLRLKVRAGMARFPEDGLTIETLVACAEEGWLRSPETGGDGALGGKPASGRRTWLQPWTRE
jgi:hypothetical protein